MYQTSCLNRRSLTLIKVTVFSSIFAIAISLLYVGVPTYADWATLKKGGSDAKHNADNNGLDYPLFSYKYNEVATAPTDSSIALDPCVNVSLPNGGREAKSGEGITVLVTGGAGFIGSNLVDRLLELGYKVRIFDNLYTGFIRNVPLQDKRVEFFFGDIGRREELRKVVDGVDFVFHLAAMSKVVPSLKSPAMARFCTEVNALGSWNVLDVVRENGYVKKVIYAASSTYYGNKPAPHQEDMAPDFLTPYAASKYEGELQMQMFDRLFHVPTISTRFFMVYGPRQPSTGAYAIVTGVFAKQASQGKPLTIEGDGSHYRDFIHVKDIVEGLILSQQSPDLRGDVVNLGTGSAFSVKEVADLVSADQVHVDARKNDLEGTLADTCKMKRLLSYNAKADFKKEMAYMAKQTMEGNVFMQSWLKTAHALSTPHLLAPGTPVFKWPTKTDDLEGLLSALKKLEEGPTAEGKSGSKRISVIPFATTKDEDSELVGDLMLNTIFSLVRFGGVKSYIVAVYDDDALANCTALNLPCIDVRSHGTIELIYRLISRNYDVHVAQLGNSYVHSVDTTLQTLIQENSNADIISAKAQGDFFVRANERTKVALAEWNKTTGTIEDIKTLFITDRRPDLSLKKAEYSADQLCQTKAAVDTSDMCKNTLYVSVACPEADKKTTHATIETLKLAGAWHLNQCSDREKCDRQQVVPLRWINRPPDLAESGGLC